VTPPGTSALAPLLPTNRLNTPAQPYSPLSWGPLTAHPHLDYQVLYGDAYPSSPGRNLKSVINNVSPGLTVVGGSRWQLDYTPTLRFYSNPGFQDTTDHNASFQGGVASDRWTAQFQQGFSDTTQPLIETGQQTSYRSYTTGLDANYIYSEHVTLELSASQNIRDSQQAFASSRDWSTMDWVSYRFNQKFSAGLGLGGGYTDLQGAPGMPNEMVQARVTYAVSKRVSLNLSGGTEIREFLTPGASALVTPIFSATALWHPFEHTQVSLNASRTVSPSFFNSQITEGTSVGLGLSQGIWKRISFDLDTDYRLTKYDSTPGGTLPANGRNDTYYDVRPALRAALFQKVTASVFFQYTRNASNTQGYRFDGRQEGFELSYRF
jgi:hypothetical protein